MLFSGQGNDHTANTGSRIRRKLLATASAVAISVAVYGQSLPARAEPGADQGPWLLLEGQKFWVEGDDQIWTERATAGGTTSAGVFTVTPDDGLTGRIGVGIPVGDGLSVAAYARLGVTDKERDGAVAAYPFFVYNVLGGAYPTSYQSGRVSHKERHAVVDFEVRKDVGLGGIDATAKAGIRYADFKADTDTTFSYQYYYFSAPFVRREDRKATFRGIGPRIGLDVRIPLRDGLQLDVSGSGSYLWGRKKIKVTSVANFGGPNGVLKASDNDSVWNLEGSAALTFVTDHAQFSAGLRVEQWWGVFDQRRAFAANGDFGEGDANRFHWGPFARVTLSAD